MRNDPDRLEWWISPDPGGTLAGPFTEAAAKELWQAGRAEHPSQGVWRGPDAQHVQGAHPSWMAGAPPSEQPPAEWAAQLTNAELADALAQFAAGHYVRPDYRTAMLRDAARRLAPRAGWSFPLDLPAAGTDDPRKGWRVMDEAGASTDYESRGDAGRALRDQAGSAATYARKDSGEWWLYETLLREN
jgi:hypothetical protein